MEREAMLVLACMRRYLCLALFTGCAAGPVLLMAQDTSAGTQELQHVCMWNEAVCQDGNIVSIGVVATDNDMSGLDTLHDVKELSFMIGPNQAGGLKISDAGFAHVQSLGDLEILHAVDLPLLTDDALRSLSSLYHLQQVRLEFNGNFTDAGLAHLEHLKRVQTLTLYGSPVTDRGILYLRELTDLQNLQLGRSLVTDEGARQIAQFRNLRVLDLQGTKVTDRGIANIATLPHLEWLCLKDTSVTDSGILALRSARTLRDLYITAGTVRDESISSLEQSLPGLKVHQ